MAPSPRPATTSPRPLPLGLTTAVALVAATAALVAVNASASAPPPTPAPHHVTVTLHSRQAVHTPLPTPVPTPVPTAVPTPPPHAAVVVVVRTAPPPPPPAPKRNLLLGPNGLDTGVGIYSDCSGATALTHAAAAIDTCVGGRTYFVGHNPGVFTPLMSTGVGSVITWYDGSGRAHRLQVVAVRTWYRVNGVPPLATAGVVAQFQTCIASDGSVDRILDAVAI